MRAMKHGTASIQGHAHSRATSFGDFCTTCTQQGFNGIPTDVGTNGLVKDGA